MTPAAGVPERNLLIDCAKGVSIALVVLGHTKLITQMPELNAVLGLIRMPLFFFLAGLFLRPHRTVARVAALKADSLLKPYFVTLAVIGVLGWPGENSGLLDYLLGVLYGTGQTIALLPLWFLTHLWLLHLFAAYLVRRTRLYRQPGYMQGAFIVILMAPGAVTVHSFWPVSLTLNGHGIQTGLPFSMDLLPLSTGFFLLGFVLKEQIPVFVPKAPQAVLAAAIFVLAYTLFDPRMDMNTRVLQTPVIAAACALAGIYLVMAFCYLLCRVRELQQLFSYLGSMSLFVLIFHVHLQGVAVRLLHIMGWNFIALEAMIINYLSALLFSAALGSLITRTPVISKLYLPMRQFKAYARATD